MYSRPAQLIAIDAASDTFGLAAGVQLGEPSRPVVFYTEDGSTWHEGSLPEGLDGMRGAAVACGAAGNGWLAANIDGARGTALVGTQDGGVTWTSVETNVATNAHIRGLAVSPE